MQTVTGIVDCWKNRTRQSWNDWESTQMELVGDAIVSCPTLESGDPSNNMYGIIIKITAPDVIDANYFSEISIGISVVDANATKGYLYGALRTVDDTTSTELDTVESFKTDLAGGSSVQAISPTSDAYRHYEYNFTGIFEKNTSYYLWLFTESINDIYYLKADTSYTTNITCNCSYEIATYTISYNANGHGITPSSQIKTYNENITLREAIQNIDDIGNEVSYNSNGSTIAAPSPHTNIKTWVQSSWNTKANGTGIEYAISGNYTVNADVTLYAQWSYVLSYITVKDAITRNTKISTYNIKYNANGGNSTPVDQILTRSTPYTFKEWNTNSSGTGMAYAPGDSIKPTTSTILYAIWNAGSTTGSINLASAISKEDTIESGYVVTLNTNGGTVDETSLTTTNTRSYTFNKWNTNPSGTGTNYSAGDLYSTESDLTLYATFTSKISSVGPVSLPIPTKSGYKFLGWSTTNGGTTYVDKNYTPNGDITLYANYKEGYDINMYIYNGGRWMNVLM